MQQQCCSTNARVDCTAPASCLPAADLCFSLDFVLLYYSTGVAFAVCACRCRLGGRVGLERLGVRRRVKLGVFGLMVVKKSDLAVLC